MTDKTFEAGEYEATTKGYLFDKIVNEGETVIIGKSFIENNPKFSASWLEKVPAKNPDKQKAK